MAVATAPPRETFTSPQSVEHRTGLRLSTGTYQRRPWQIGLGVALVLVCAAVTGAVLNRQMLSSGPQIAPGEQVVGMLLRGVQMPPVRLVAGDAVQVVAVP